MNAVTEGQGIAASPAEVKTQQTAQPAGHHVAEPAPNRRPNVLWILGDQFRAVAERNKRQIDS